MWHKVENGLPKIDGQYLCLTKIFNKYTSYHVLDFAKDLSKVDKYDFGEHKSGFYSYDSEMGYYEYCDVIYWMKIPELPKGE